jgi:signal transduction histidine kinase
MTRPLEGTGGFERLLSDLGHDLRTPLTVIRGAATLLQHSLDEIPRDRQLEMLDLIDRESEAMSDRIEDMLALAGLEAGRLRVQAPEVGLQEVLDPVLAWARRRGWQVSPGASGWKAIRVGADIDRVGQALRCLLRIGLQRAGRAMTIEAGPTPGGARIEIGVGSWGSQDLDPEAVFDAGRGPLGFGPHLARALVRAMGGEVRVTRGENGEVTFSVTLLEP